MHYCASAERHYRITLRQLAAGSALAHPSGWAANKSSQNWTQLSTGSPPVVQPPSLSLHRALGATRYLL